MFQNLNYLIWLMNKFLLNKVLHNNTFNRVVIIEDTLNLKELLRIFVTNNSLGSSTSFIRYLRVFKYE